MKWLERWQSPRPSTWLLLRPGPEPSRWNWLLEGGQVREEGEGPPPCRAGMRVALILPGQQCSHCQLPAPPGLKREEWPLLLEERLLQPAESIRCGCVSRQGTQLELVSVDRALLEQWLAQCADWGLNVERCWAEFQLLPETPAGTALCWQRSTELLLCKGATAQARQHWLAWPTALGANLPAPWPSLQCQAFEGNWPPRLAVLERLPSLFELRAPRRLQLSIARGHWRLLAACMVLGMLCSGLWLTQQWRQNALYKAQVVAVTGPVDSPRQAAQALKRLRQAQDSQRLHLRQIAQVQLALEQWLQSRPAWHLVASGFDGQRLRMRLHGDQPPDIDTWQSIAGQLDLKVEATAVARELQLVFDLGAAS
ncbi:type II secretion system protein GspL [Pseudomonas rubra]|uniref:Type II secretion system protein GspL n=1 Tax=Pseudomonas rubra TaxID=2942627 RepID=A0ABT5P7M4_9PSED|nr:type II secretion system protein GspL [Pseudomonas rubra]MDD1014258.1 type II secretion system protein GspL [Pseudomonas rubra]MDD1037627.1 type II secretion system protein GspL [Pseudomonas rubra]MDD1155723.1 type II secretion system protein GspL [Pseudomonas rubra]